MTWNPNLGAYSPLGGVGATVGYDEVPQGQVASSFQTVPALGAKTVLFSHSLGAGGGVSGNPINRAWHTILAGLLRGQCWDQGVGGAVMAKAALTRGATGYGGITQLLQGLVPNPSTGTNWRGAYNAGVTYGYGDGVASGGNWYRCESAAGQVGVAPPGGGWVEVLPGPASLTGEAGQGYYLPMKRVPMFWYGTNDLGYVAQANEQPFLSAMEAGLARGSASAIYDANSTMHFFGGGTWTNVPNNYTGSGTSVTIVPNTAGAFLEFVTPIDWCGGYVDLRFAVGNVATSGVWGGGILDFTVDSVAVNVLNSGTPAVNAGVVNFGSPNRNHIDCSALTTALVAGTPVTTLAVGALPEAVTSGDTVTVGVGANVDTFVASATAAVNATSISVTSHAPTFAHAVGDSVYDAVTAWVYNANTVVRVPVPAGQHIVAATVPTSPSINQLYFNGTDLESPAPPPMMIPGLPYLENYIIYWTSRLVHDEQVDTWNAALKTLLTQFPSAQFVDMTQVLRPSASLTVALTAGQTGITALAVSPTPYAIAINDNIQIGSGISQESTTASAAVPAGSTVIPVNSFTSVNTHGVGHKVWDSNQTMLNFFVDGVHPSDLGHELIAAAMYDAFVAATANLTPAQLAHFLGSNGEDVVPGRISAGNLVVGTGVANVFAPLKPSGGSIQTLSIPADPGDIIEVQLNGAWDATIACYFDLCTLDPYSLTMINRFSGSTFAGNAGSSGLGADSVGVGQATGLPGLWTFGVASNDDKISGTLQYVVQAADIRATGVTIALVGACSTIATSNLIFATAAAPFYWSLKKLQPMSWNGESA